jgi:hypothetical protein
MSKDGRTWFPLDAAFTSEDKVADAGERAGWLYIAMLGRIKTAGAHGTLTKKQIGMLGIRGWEGRLADLVRVGLVIQLDPNVYRIPAWEDWQGGSQRAAYMRQWRAKAAKPPRLTIAERGDEK